MGSNPLKDDAADKDLVVSAPKKSAVGVPGLLASIPLALNEMGPVRAVKVVAWDGFEENCDSISLWRWKAARTVTKGCGCSAGSSWPTLRGKGAGSGNSMGTVVALVNGLEALALPAGWLNLQSLCSHDHFNRTYCLNDRYRGVREERGVQSVNPTDLASPGLADGSYMDVHSEAGDGMDRVLRSLRILAYPTAEGSNTPISKSLIVRLEPVPAPFFA